MGERCISSLRSLWGIPNLKTFKQWQKPKSRQSISLMICKINEFLLNIKEKCVDVKNVNFFVRGHVKEDVVRWTMLNGLNNRKNRDGKAGLFKDLKFLFDHVTIKFSPNMRIFLLLFNPFIHFENICALFTIKSATLWPHKGTIPVNASFLHSV